MRLYSDDETRMVDEPLIGFAAYSVQRDGNQLVHRHVGVFESLAEALAWIAGEPGVEPRRIYTPEQVEQAPTKDAP